ncbi:hypothetical protein KAR48_01485 [bacterium]|nr:hypothetical protein [bacterium]
MIRQISKFFFIRCFRTLVLVFAGLMFALTLSSIINVDVVKNLNNQIKNPILILYAELLGFIAPGPRYILYPILVQLKEYGVGYSIIIALISGHVLIEPSTIFMEYGFMGYRFPLKRFIASFIVTYLAGLLTYFIFG